jgi:hypothetical protein
MIDHDARAEDITWFVETGENLTGAARRLGISRAGVEKWCRLHGMREEYARLCAREPFDPETDLSARGRAGAMGRWAS